MRMRRKKHLDTRMDLVAGRVTNMQQTDRRFGTSEEQHTLCYAELFGNDNPVELEIGCGKGGFICQLAANNPDVNYIAVEKYGSSFFRNGAQPSGVLEHPGVLKDPQNTDSNETTVRIEFDLTDTIFDVRDRMNAAVEQSRATEDGDFVIRLARAVLAIPGLATLIVAIVKLLDRYGIAPRTLIKELPFYSGMFITNNGSIGLHHPFHHIYNFGDVSLFIGMGSILKEAIVEDGKTRMKRWLPLGMTADERVCSGAHYAAFFFDVMRLLEHPEELETPPEHVRFEQGVEYHVPKIKKNEQ